MWREDTSPMARCSVMAKILILAGVPSWSMARVCKGVQAHSKHDIELTHFWLTSARKLCTPSDWDAIYIHSGAVMNGPNKDYITDHRNDTKWAIGLRGPTAYMRNVNRLKSDLWDAFSVGSAMWMDRLAAWKKFEIDVPGFVCHGGIDTSLFTVQPFPDTFVIAWAGRPNNGAKSFYRFGELPFNKQATGGGGFKVERKSGYENIKYIKHLNYPDMNDFYASSSMYVNTSFSEGGPLPPKEAAAAGRPVVCTRTGDAPEWVPEEYIVDTKSRSFDRDKMVKMIGMFKDDRDLLELEGKRFKELSKRFDFSVVAKEYDRMFDEMIK